MYTTYIKAVHDAFSDVVSPALQNLEATFAPVSPPKSDEWLDILLSVIGLVGTVGGSALFNSCACCFPFLSLFHIFSSVFSSLCLVQHLITSGYTRSLSQTDRNASERSLDVWVHACPWLIVLI